MFNVILCIIVLSGIIPNSVQLPDVVVPNTIQNVSTAEKNYFGGSIMVHILYAESDGSIDPNEETWASNELDYCNKAVVNALEWYKSLYNYANITYTISSTVVTTPYEISRHTLAEESMWLGSLMHSPYGIDILRQTIDEDKKKFDNSFFIIFVRNKNTDTYVNTSMGYAYLNGPYALVHPTMNLETEATIAHEMGHIFNALDQYKGAGYGCLVTSGVYNTPNENSEAGTCSSNVISIMRYPLQAWWLNAVDKYAQEQMGIKDDNCNSVIDYIDKDKTNHCITVFIPYIEKQIQL